MDCIKYIKADLGRYGINFCFLDLVRLRSVHLFIVTFRLRKVNKLLNVLLFPLWKFLSIYTGFQIDWKTKIGPGLYLGHKGSVIINGNAIIGANVNINHGVTIGKHPRHHGSSPSIGDNVWLGPNSVIVGNIFLGSNVIIGANVVVSRDIESNKCVVLSSEQRDINFEMIETYIKRRYND